MSNQEYKIKLKLKRSTDNANLPLEQGELGLDINNQELKIGINTNPGEQSWSDAVSLNRLKKKNTDEDTLYPGQMVYDENNNLKINMSDSFVYWEDAISLNHIKTHTNADGTPKLNIGELSFNIDTGEVLIQGRDNKLYEINRIRIIQNQTDVDENELIYVKLNENEGYLALGTSKSNTYLPLNSNFLFTSTNPKTAPDFQSKINYDYDTETFIIDEKNINGIYIEEDKTHIPLHKIKFKKEDNSFYQINESGDDTLLNFNKAVWVESNGTLENDSIIPDENKKVYPKGTIIYHKITYTDNESNQKTLQQILIGDGTTSLSNLEPILGGGNSGGTVDYSSEIGTGQLI